MKKNIEKISKFNNVINDVIDLYRKGYLQKEMIEKICTDHDISVRYAYHFLDKGSAIIEKKIKRFDKKYLFGLHLTRYERVFKEQMDFLENEVTASTDYKQFVNAVQACLQALYHKERMLGLRDGNAIIINNEVIVKGDARGKRNYDFTLDVLDFEEKKEMLGLIKKSRNVQLDGVWELVPAVKYDVSKIEEAVVVEEKNDMPEDVVSKIGKPDVDELREVTKKKSLDDVMKAIKKEDKNILLQVINTKKEIDDKIN